MTAQVLLLGGTGRTGQRVLEQLLSRDISVRAIVRSTQKLPTGVLKNCNLTLIEADLLSLSDKGLQSHVRGCDAVISCLGHTPSLKGVFGPPRDLVTQAARRVCGAIEALHPAEPVKFILMSSVSVNHPLGLGTRRGLFERGFVWMIRAVIPPAKDNQQAANFLCESIGTDNPLVQWVAVRPDTLLEADVSDYTLHQGLVSTIFAPDQTSMANVAHFMCELATNPKVWDVWRGMLPVVINGNTSRGRP